MGLGLRHIAKMKAFGKVFGNGYVKLIGMSLSLLGMMVLLTKILSLHRLNYIEKSMKSLLFC